MNAIVPTLSYCAIMAATYILFYGLSSHLFKKIKMYYEIVLGFVIGVISIFATMAATTISHDAESKNFIAYLQILDIFICGIFISAYAMLPVVFVSILLIFLLPNYISDIFFSEMTGINTINLAVIIGVSTIVLTVFYFIKHKWSKSLIFLFAMTATESILLISLLANFSNSDVNILFEYIIWFVAGYLLFAVAFLTDRIHNHAIRLREIIEVEDEFYISSGGVKEKLKLLISKDHVRYGFLFSYFITQYDLLDRSVSPVIRDFIWQSITSQIKNKILEINPKAFFFHENYKVNGFFLPIDHISASDLQVSYDGNVKKARLEKDVLKKINDIFDTVTLNYNVENYRISIKFRSVCSVYGIHSTNFDRLIENNGIFINQKDRLVDKNQIFMVDPKELNDLEYEQRKLKTLNSVTTINNSSILYEPVYDVKNDKISSIFLNYIVDGNVVIPFSENTEQMNLIMDYGMYSMFFRFLAFKGLKEAKSHLQNNKDMNLFLFYDSKYLSSENFSPIELITKVKKTGIKKENIIFTFDTGGEIENPEVLAENIVKLKGYGIRIALLNYKATKYEFAITPFYQPDFIIVDPSISNAVSGNRDAKQSISGIIDIAKKIEAKVVAEKVKSFLVYKTLKTLGVDEVFGEIIGSSTQFKDQLTQEQKILLHK